MGRRRSGFTLVEVVIALVIMVLLAKNLSMVFETSTEAAEAERLLNALDMHAQVTMDRMTLALMSSSTTELDPLSVAPLNSSRMDYQTGLGSDELGEILWGDPERIELLAGTGQVVWRENPGLEGERSVVWTSWVPEFLEREMLNGLDDNSNEVIDERGLSFNVIGNQVIIRLTLEREDSEGRTYHKTLESRVTCRN